VHDNRWISPRGDPSRWDVMGCAGVWRPREAEIDRYSDKDRDREIQRQRQTETETETETDREVCDGCMTTADPAGRPVSGGLPRVKTETHSNGHLKLSRPRLVPARPKVCTSHVREPLRFYIYIKRMTTADSAGRSVPGGLPRVARLCRLPPPGFVLILIETKLINCSNFD